jgi:hypothetical protein
MCIYTSESLQIWCCSALGFDTQYSSVTKHASEPNRKGMVECCPGPFFEDVPDEAAEVVVFERERRSEVLRVRE